MLVAFPELTDYTWAYHQGLRPTVRCLQEYYITKSEVHNYLWQNQFGRNIAKLL